MNCLKIVEGPNKWKDNYLCLPFDSPYEFSWSYSGIITDTSCMPWFEPSGGDSWEDNFLCADPMPEPTRIPSWPEEFKWAYSGVPDEGYDCIQIDEPAWNNWDDNYFCWKWGTKNPGLKWSHTGAAEYTPYMDCLQIRDPSNNDKGDDNYLCSPLDFPYNFVWSYAGTVKGKDCIKWSEGSTNSWDDNYLCA